MRVTIELQMNDAKALFKRFPAEMKTSMDEFIDRVGFKLELEAKKDAPAITGNLRRNIVFASSNMGSMMQSGARGELTAHANYSKYVHGQPFYKNRIRRRETPFISNALETSDSFIKREAKAMIDRVIK